MTSLNSQLYYSFQFSTEKFLKIIYVSSSYVKIPLIKYEVCMAACYLY